ncbi:MAG: hypothetical protein WCH61_02860 [bacterium]
METLSVVDLTAEPMPLAAMERLVAGAKVVVLPFPPARDAREFGRLGRAVKRANVVAVVAHPLLGRPGWAKVMEWLASGVLGTLERLDLDLRTSALEGKTVDRGENASCFTRRPDQSDHGLWPALDFTLRLPSRLPQLCFRAPPDACELGVVAESASIARWSPVIRLTWQPSGDGRSAERLLIQGATGRLELTADRHHAATVRLVLATGHEITLDVPEFPPIQLVMAWARHAAGHGLTGGPFGLARLAPLYDWLARA